MKDIFEILRHEDTENHELEIVKFDNGFLLGCKTCGETLLSTEDLREGFKYIELIKTLKERNKEEGKAAELLELVLKIGKLALEPNENDYIAFVNKIRRDINNKLVSNKNSNDTLYNSFARFNLYNEITHRYMERGYALNYDNLALHLYEDPSQELLKITKEVVKRLKKEEYQKETIEYKFYSYDSKEWPIAGCYEYKLHQTYKKECSILVTILSEMEKLEKDCPTPCDVYTFKDMDDYYEKVPCWDDEEDENALFREYMYRLENDLYDFSNLNTQKIIEGCIQVFEDYDGVERYTKVLRKLLLNK